MYASSPAAVPLHADEIFSLQPLPRSVDSALDEQARRVEQLEADIKRDEMEIFALQEIQPERQKEVRLFGRSSQPADSYSLTGG